MRKLALHTAFWLAYWFIYAYSYSRYDGNMSKYMLSESIQMPARMLATYSCFFLLDRWTNRGWLALSGLAAVNIAGGMLNRLFKLLYVVPVFFPDSTIHYWDLGRMMVDIFDCVLASGVALSARLFFRQQESRRLEEQLRREKAEVELRALKSQLQPHFLFNTINNLYALARMKSEKTAPVALQLANLLRFVLYETRKPHIPIEQEVKILRDYIALEQLRFDDDRLRVETIIELDDPQQPVAPLLLLPLIENAFKHGVGELRYNAWVQVFVRLKDGHLRMEVGNSVESRPEFNPDGIGLANVKRQLELLYPGRSRLLTLQPGQAQTANTGEEYRALLEIDFK